MKPDDLEPVRRSDAVSTVISEDLSEMSMEELEERINLLEAEIARIHREIDQKKGSLTLAETFFRNKDG